MINQIIGYYELALGHFPAAWHGPISLGLAILLVILTFQTLRKSGIWLLALVILLPALLPTLRGVGLGIVELVKYLLSRAVI